MERERDETIDNLLQQLTRAQVQEAASQKLIKQLQDKLQLLAPNSGDTGANFMLASEFRASYEQLMTFALPSLLAPLADRPLLYAQVTATLIASAYASAQRDVEAAVERIKGVLGASSAESVRQGVLRMLQENWEHLVQLEERVRLEENFEGAEEVNEALQGEEGLEVRRLVRQLVGFMVLQEKQWQFVGLGCENRVKYSKKECVCIDGWVKEGEEALVVVSGIAKDGQPVPNFKSYVLPNEPGCLPFVPSLLPTPPQLMQPPTLSHSCLLSPNHSQLADLTNLQLPSPNHHDDKENNPRTLNSRAKNRPKRADCSGYERSPTAKAPKRMDKEEEQGKMKRQDLPLSKDPMKKKAKASTSRKASAGKIVSQQLAATQMQKDKARATERTYKEIIKDKLAEIDRGATPKARPRKDKQRERVEECRPLKLMGGSQKLREKYIF